MSMEDHLLAAMRSQGAPEDLEELAKSRFASRASLAEACHALHGQLTALAYDYWNRLWNQGLDGADGRVLSWFLRFNTSCVKLRWVVISPSRMRRPLRRHRGPVGRHCADSPRTRLATRGYRH